MKLDNPSSQHPSSQCFLCSTADPHTILHQIRHGGTYRRLCTNCVLLSSHGLFCPFCFTFYSLHPPSSSHRAICLTCPSIAHLSCASAQGITPFRCPPCLDSRFRYFRGKRGDGVVDEGSGKALVCAAMVAAESMSRAAVAARVEAERRVKEAVLAKKRAKEALERVAVLVRMSEVVEAEKDGVIDDALGVEGRKRKSGVNGAEEMSKNGVSLGRRGKKLRLENGNNGA